LEGGGKDTTSLSDAQPSAVLEAKRLLANVGLTTATNSDDRDFQEVSRVLEQILPCLPTTAAVPTYPYCPLAALLFTAEEIRQSLDCINRQTYVHALVEHRLGSIVEYPETGAGKGVVIVHRFSVDPSNFSHPKENFQYSIRLEIPMEESRMSTVAIC
jgi:hypothetical protein